jgi:hypothetical protein
MSENNGFDLAAMRAQIEAELTERIRKEVEAEFQAMTSRSMSLKDVAEKRGITEPTALTMLDRAGVKSISGSPKFKLYDPRDVTRAIMYRDRDALKYWGLLTQVEEANGVKLSDVTPGK